MPDWVLIIVIQKIKISQKLQEMLIVGLQNLLLQDCLALFLIFLSEIRP
jgi:hypothetical protein